jgi:predicted N-formylglutamate amidohydrolase
LSMAKTLAAALNAPLVAATVSRLLVDLNRSVGHPRLHLDVVRRASAERRRQILRNHYFPHRERVEQWVRRLIGEHGLAIHIACHSFTPVLDEIVRKADIGLLYDPARAGEASLCRSWKMILEKNAPDLIIRRNYPYAGKDDGLTTWLRSRFRPDAYIGVELEINQKHVKVSGRDWSALRQQIAASLCKTLANRDHPKPSGSAEPQEILNEDTHRL